MATAVAQHFSWLAPAEAKRLVEIDASPFPAADGAALLLGNDLWIEPLVAFRQELNERGDRPPPLWSFPWEPSAAWDTRQWRALPLAARIVRARAGSLAHRVDRRFTAQMLNLAASEFAQGLGALRGAGIMIEAPPHALEPIASAADLRTDLSLVELLVHWLRMLDHGDRVMKNSPGTGFDVCGYSGACSECRALWGAQPRVLEVVPPFHPGCRCFAQPRFASVAPVADGGFDENLIRALDHAVADVASSAARVLGRRKCTAALDALLRTSRSGEPERAEAALEALAAFNDARVEERLREALRSGTVRERALVRRIRRLPS